MPTRMSNLGNVSSKRTVCFRLGVFFMGHVILAFFYLCDNPTRVSVISHYPHTSAPAWMRRHGPSSPDRCRAPVQSRRDLSRDADQRGSDLEHTQHLWFPGQRQQVTANVLLSELRMSGHISGFRAESLVCPGRGPGKPRPPSGPAEAAEQKYLPPSPSLATFPCRCLVSPSNRAALLFIIAPSQNFADFFLRFTLK